MTMLKKYSGDVKLQPCPHCEGRGYCPDMRYDHSMGGKAYFHSWKYCTHCRGTGVNIEHLLFTVLQLPVKGTPPRPEGDDR